MPPNRKTNVTLLNDLPTIDVAQLKLPVAHNTQQQQPPPKQEENYWDEATEENDAELKRLQEEANLQNTLSTSRIEENLLKESQRLEGTQSQGKKEAPNNTESDDYWNMPSEGVPSTIVSPHEASVAAAQQAQQAVKSASYWNWPSNQDASTNEKHIQRVLDEERARRLTSTAFVEQNLVEAGCAADSNTEHKLNPANDSYWVC